MKGCSLLWGRSSGEEEWFNEIVTDEGEWTGSWMDDPTLTGSLRADETRDQAEPYCLPLHGGEQNMREMGAGSIMAWETPVLLSSIRSRLYFSDRGHFVFKWFRKKAFSFKVYISSFQL